MKVKFALLTLIVLACCGPFSLRYETTLVGYRLEHVERKNITAIIGKDYQLPLVAKFTSEDFLVVTIQAETDPWEGAQRRGAVVSSDAYFCDFPRRHAILNLPELYWRGRGSREHLLTSESTGPFEQRRMPRPEMSADGKFYEYQVVIFEKFIVDRPENGGEGTKPYYKYDLGADPQDICVSLSGGSMATLIRSNKLRIPKEEIEKAFAQ